MSIRITHLRAYENRCVACFHTPGTQVKVVIDECLKHHWGIEITPIEGVPAIEADIHGATKDEFLDLFGSNSEFVVDPYPRAGPERREA